MNWFVQMGKLVQLLFVLVMCNMNSNFFFLRQKGKCSEPSRGLVEPPPFLALRRNIMLTYFDIE